MECSFWSVDEQVTAEENEILDKDFSEDEIKNAVFQSYADGALGPDGFPFLFYQTFRDTIKHELIALFRDFEQNQADLFRINFCYAYSDSQGN